MSEPVRFTVDSNDMSINVLCDDIDRGKIRLPKYQRDFVWGANQVCALWDSIIKNISLGSITIWETVNRLDDDRSIGGLLLNPVDKLSYLQYALDGQQRITSIYGAYKGLKIGKVDFKKFYVDVSKDPQNYFPESSVLYIEDISKVPNKDDYFNLHSLITKVIPNFNFSGLSGNVVQYGLYFAGFKISAIITKGNNKNIARELFVRTNNTGKTLTPYEISCAAIYSESDHFYFSDKVDAFIKKFESFGYKEGTVSENEILKTLTVIYCNDYINKKVLDINIEYIISDWSKFIESYSRMVDFVKESINVVTINSVQYKVIYALFANNPLTTAELPSGTTYTTIPNLPLLPTFPTGTIITRY